MVRPFFDLGLDTPLTATEAAIPFSTSAPATREAVGSRRDRWASGLAAAALLALWLLAHPYAGIIHDARLYVGRALADLDPNGLGKDLLFANDGQSGFTVYRPMIRTGVAAVGAGPAAMSATLVNLILWFSAAASFASPYAGGRRLAAVLAAVSILEPTYGGFLVFRYGEAFASPRPLAEAAVMVGLGLLASGRIWWALLPILLAGALHPVMALPGVMIAFFVHAHRDRRLWLLPVVGAAAVLAAALMRLPLADRLLITADPAWMAVMQARTPYLFALDWLPGDWGRTFVQFTLVGFAAAGTAGRLRSILIAILSAAAVGVLATLVFCDGLHDILALQLQPWRALWPLTVVANGALPLILFTLWARGARGRAAAGLLTLAWLIGDITGAGALAAMVCVAAAGWALRAKTEPDRRLVQIVLAAAAAVGVIEFGQCLFVAAQTAFLQPPPRSHISLLSLWRSGAPGLLVLAALAALAIWRRGRPFSSRLLAVLLAATAIPTLLLWDDRPFTQRHLEDGRPDPALQQALGPTAGAVLWVGGDVQPWLLARRPTWATSIQGASTVFSRPLALAWDDRMRRLIALGLATEGDRRPFTSTVRIAHANSVTAAHTICGWPDRPSALLVAGHRPIPGAVYWKPTPPEMRVMTDGKRFFWRGISEYTVVRCPQTDPASPTSVGAAITPRQAAR